MTTYAGDLSEWKLSPKADVARMLSVQALAKIPLDWPLSRVNTMFATPGILKKWITDSKFKGLAAWQCAQTKTRPPWFTKDEFEALQLARDVLLQLGADPKKVIQQSWQQWHEATFNAPEELVLGFDFSS